MSKRRRERRRRDGHASTARAVGPRLTRAGPRGPAPPGTTLAEDRASRGRALPRGPIFALLCAACLLVALGVVLTATRRAESAGRRAAADPAAVTEAIAALSGQPHLLFLDSQGDAYRRLALAPLSAADGSRQVTDLQCQRVHFAAGQGLCLGQTQFGGAYTFGPDLRPRHTLQVSGLPSRARVSPDGRYGTMTVFVAGHSYAEGGFSTQTTLVDMIGGSKLADLEEFTIYRDGARFQAPDFNFWGVTFARDGQRFYATLASQGQTHLIAGDLAAREASVIRENVECPSLSPDGTRLVFKKRVSAGPGPITWQLHLLDLATLAERPLGETRNVDDQVEWLDDGQILYSLRDKGPPATIRPDVWVLTVDTSDPPRRLQTAALSPTVVR